MLGRAAVRSCQERCGSWIATPACADVPAREHAAQPASQAASQPAKPKLDYSGRTHVGKASFYAHKFAGRIMADGTRMDPKDDNAASHQQSLASCSFLASQGDRKPIARTK